MKDEEKCEMKREKEKKKYRKQKRSFHFYFFFFPIFFAHFKIRNSGI